MVHLEDMGLYGKYLIEKYARIPTEVDIHLNLDTDIFYLETMKWLLPYLNQEKLQIPLLV